MASRGAHVMDSPGRLDLLLALALGVALPIGAALGQRRASAELEAPLTTRHRIAFYWTNGLVLVLLAAVVVGLWAWQGRPLATLGLRRPIASPGAPAAWAIALVLLAAYAWFLSRPSPVAAPDDPRWRKLARSAAATVLVAIGLPLLALSLLFGVALWKLLIAGWIWVLGGGVLGLTAAFGWELVANRIPERVRDPAGRVIFWVFFVIGGLGLLLLAVRFGMRQGA